MTKTEEDLRHLSMKGKKRVENLNIKKTKILTNGTINLWYVDGDEIEMLPDFVCLGSEIYAHRYCSLFLRWKAMTNLNNALKRREMTLITKINVVESLVFPTV